MSRETVLARTLVQLADTLVDEFDVVELLTLLVDRCVEILQVDASGIMLAPNGGLRVIASSSETMRMLELFEVQAQEGPCLDAHRTGEQIAQRELANANDVWPRFAAEALEAGFHSVQALPMRHRGEIIGALNLFHRESREMPRDDIDVAQAFADVATITILQNRADDQSQILNEQLNHALASRILIEQAKGIIAESENLDMEVAFKTLRGYARSHNLQLTDVASDVIDGKLSVPELNQPDRVERNGTRPHAS